MATGDGSVTDDGERVPPEGDEEAGAGALLHAWILDGDGGARRVDVSAVSRWQEADGVLWVHTDFDHADAPALYARIPGLDRRQARLLSSDDSRPSAEVSGEGVRLTLRGVNLRPESDPEDMVSLRLWANGHCVVSARRRRLLSIEDIVAALAEGEGPRAPGELLARVAARLIERMQGTVDGLDERIGTVEEALESRPDVRLRRDIADVRRATIKLRRHLAPQRDALTHFANAPLPWLEDADRTVVRDALDGLIRHIEDLDSTRERATVAREELANHEASLTNARMYLLSILSAIFLPLGFVTGLLGVNVGGIPGANSAHGFLVANLVLLVVALLILLFFRFKRWL